MKYLVIRDKDGVEFPVFCLAPKVHTDLAAAWRRNDSLLIVSAGFCEFLQDGSVRTFGCSSGLGLWPRPEDARLIMAFYRASLFQGEMAEQCGTEAPRL